MSTDTKETTVTKEDVTVSGFGGKVSADDKNLPENSKKNLDEALDNAVDETFPGSDPVSVKITK